ncbi:MAG: transglycosylase domain-containing protein [Parvibaculaceae bacterium]
MGGWSDAAWTTDFLTLFLPALAWFVLIHIFRPLYWLSWIALAVSAGLFLGAYHITGYPAVVVEVARQVSFLTLGHLSGFIVAAIVSRRAVALIRRWQAWQAGGAQSGAQPVRMPETGGAARALAISLSIALVVPLVVPATARAPDGRDGGISWRALLPMNQIVLDQDLRPVCHCGLPVAANEIPQHLRDALVAIEDKRFHIHRGIDPLGMLRAARSIVMGWGIEGGSTLSQQLAKFTLLSDDRTLFRKGHDIVWALKIEAAFSKDEIIRLYLDRAVFGWSQGRPVVGIEQASRHFFGKRTRDLNLYEAAVLAGLVNAPQRLNPKRNARRVVPRARLVLARMVEQGYITRREAVAALKRGVARGRERPQWIEPRYFTEWAMAELVRTESRFKPRPAMRLFVTLDTRSQLSAEATVRQGLSRLKGRGVGEAALVALDHEGRVSAMVGGRDFSESQFNRAVNARRQPASAFKPFVYMAALEQGMRPQTRILDAAPERYAAVGELAGPFHGLMTLEDALAVSANGATVRLADKVGLAAVEAAARKAGIGSPLRRERSLALGTSEVTLLELVSAYAPFANGGRKVSPQGVVAVSDRGRIVAVGADREVGRAMEKSVSKDMRRMLRAVVTRGTGRPANIAAEVAGKTGTSQKNRDALFVGFAGGQVAGLWLGNDDHSPMRGVTGTDAASVWKAYMANELAR